jgi:metallo-beta-lactamase class B
VIVRAVFLTWLFVLGQGAATLVPDPPSVCDSCAEWNAPHEPFKVFGNTYYVGAKGLSSVLITGDGGYVLIDGGLPQTAAVIDANIRKLGFDTKKIRLILNSHAHYDHAGGLAAIQRHTGAQVAATASSAAALMEGEPTKDDPQYGFGRKANAFPAIKSVRTMQDGETLRVGDIAMTAHLTPGHTPGSTTWAWQSCEGARCLNMVYADSLTPVSAPGFRFTGDKTHKSVVEAYRRGLKRIEDLPCDILLTPHPDASDLDGRLARRDPQKQADAFIDATACRAYAATGTKRLEQRIAEEK